MDILKITWKFLYENRGLAAIVCIFMLAGCMLISFLLPIIKLAVYIITAVVFFLCFMGGRPPHK